MCTQSQTGCMMVIGKITSATGMEYTATSQDPSTQADGRVRDTQFVSILLFLVAKCK